MPQDKTTQAGKPGLEMLEEAFHVLRNAPVSAWICYCVGSFPFVAMFIYFWIEMAHSGLAGRKLAGLACILVCLYAWMKSWQSVSASIIHRQLGGPAGPEWGWRRILRLACVQTAIQPFSLLIVPIASTLILPGIWMVAFFHSVCFYGDGTEGKLGHVISRSALAARARTGQNIVASALLCAVWLVILANVLTAGIFLPQLLKTLFGIESQFSRSYESMLNTTYLIVSACITYLCVNPLARAFHILRCFQNDSISTGADIRAELERIAPAPVSMETSGKIILGGRSGKLSALIIFAVALFACPAAMADSRPLTEAPPENEASAIKPDKLNKSIGEVINRSKYSWRMPRKEDATGERQQNDSFLRPIEDIGRTIDGWFNDLGRWIEKTFNTKKQNSQPSSPHQSGGKGSYGGGEATVGGVLQLLCWVGVLVVVGAIALMIWRFLKNRPAKSEDKPKTDLKARPDLTKEDVSAEDLPEDGWLDMARDFLAARDYRLAIRAMYLACLSRLSQAGLIRVARFKSNFDYRRELDRKSHQLPDLMPAFDRNLQIFEASWYGMHDVDKPIIVEFIANQERMRKSVAQG